jgi:hypothetical protein
LAFLKLNWSDIKTAYLLHSVHHRCAIFRWRRQLSPVYRQLRWRNKDSETTDYQPTSDSQTSASAYVTLCFHGSYHDSYDDWGVQNYLHYTYTISQLKKYSVTKMPVACKLSATCCADSTAHFFLLLVVATGNKLHNSSYLQPALHLAFIMKHCQLSIIQGNGRREGQG